MTKVVLRVLNKKFGKVSNIRAEKGSIRFDKHTQKKGKEVRMPMSVLIDEFL